MKAAILAVGLIWASSAMALQELVFAGGTYIAQVEWEVGPLLKDESKMHIQWVDGTTKSAIEPGAIEVELFMPKHGHGSRPTSLEQLVDQNGVAIVGAYRVNKMYFIMPGAWRVDVILNGETQSFDVEIEGQGHDHH